MTVQSCWKLTVRDELLASLTSSFPQILQRHHVGNLTRIVYGIVRASWLLRSRTNILSQLSHRKSRISSRATNIIGRTQSRAIPHGACNIQRREAQFFLYLSHISADILISSDTMNSIAAISQYFSQLSSTFSTGLLNRESTCVLLFKRSPRSAASMRVLARIADASRVWRN